MLLIQGIFVVFLGLTAAIIYDWIIAFSIFLGGLIGLLPSMFFAYRLFKETGARAAVRIIRNFYIGSLVKLVLVGVLFVLVINYFTVNVLAVVLGFAFSQVILSLSPLVLLLHKRYKRA